MQLKNISSSLPVVSVLIAHGAFSQPTSFTYKNYRIEKQRSSDSAMLQFITPYSDSIKNFMNHVIGFSVYGMMRKQPEGALGNFVTDGIRSLAEKRFNKKVDVALINPGGIRSYIPKGDITAGKIFELVPYDNLIVLQEVTGKVLLALLDKTAEKGGWAVSGVQMGIRDKKAVNIIVGGSPLNENGTYIIAIPGNIANGGDECDMLRGVPQINFGCLLRDIIMDYVAMATSQGKPADARVENRVVYVN